MKESDNYESDLWILNLFKNYYDPCPYYSDLDLLNEDWSKHSFTGVYINPPYSNVTPWIKKAIETKNNHPRLNVVMLLKHDTSTKWFSMLHEHGAKFLMIQGRLKFQTKKAAPFPSVLVVL
tara:strand:+ start:301 stop:663 length:363 start_codon:yes stop_codon:yes gene_type:complete